MSRTRAERRRLRQDRERGNYAPAVEVLVEQLRRHGRGSITHVEVEHEDRCAIWNSGPCDCEADVRVTRAERVIQEGEDDA